VAVELELPVSEVEACCTRLSRRAQLIQVDHDSEWPDGTLAASFRSARKIAGARAESMSFAPAAVGAEPASSLWLQSWKGYYK
jgi:hypothetical protein